MIKKGSRLLLCALVLCLCGLLWCSAALAEMYTISVADYAEVRQYCQSFVLFIDGDNFENVSSVSIDPFTFPSAQVGVRIVPNPGCGVESIKFRESGSYTKTCQLIQGASGEVTAYFDLPMDNMTVTVTMSHPEVVTSKVEASFLYCEGTISDGTQTGGESIFAQEGSTVTVTAAPLEGYYITGMTYTTLNDPVSKTIAYTEDENGAVTGSITMPAEQVYINVTAAQIPVEYYRYNEVGNPLGYTNCLSYTLLAGSSSEYLDLNEAYGGWYVVQGTVNMSSHTTIRITGDVHLILCDGATLNANDGIYIRKGSSLSIYAQRGCTGKLNAKPDSGPGIGGMENAVGGSLYIHGGVIDAEGGTNAAAIGGGENSGSGTIVISGGNVRAVAEDGMNNIGASGIDFGGGAAIGGGQKGGVDSITITGGTVNADANKDYSGAAGIGGGAVSDVGGTITISGGNVTVSAYAGAGIGCGYDADFNGTLVISQGTVTTASKYGAGIGGGIEGNLNGTVRITGGTVNASSTDPQRGGAGIGGGPEGKLSIGGECNGTIEITGGTVTVSTADDSCQAIGHGKGGSDEGTLILGDGMRVLAGSNSTGSNALPQNVSNRGSACRSNMYAQITPCTLHQPTYALPSEGAQDHHIWRCTYCKTEGQAQHHMVTEGDGFRCADCGYAKEMIHIIYSPGDPRATGTMDDEYYVPNVYQHIRDCEYTLSGYTFIWWLVEETGEELWDDLIYAFPNTEETLHLTAVWRSKWNDLQQTIDRAYEGKIISLEDNVTAAPEDTALVIPEGQNVIIDLKGHTLSRGMARPTAGGRVIISNGTLTITDSVGGGEITGGKTAGEDAGGAILNNGTLELNGGTICENASFKGGAVLNNQGAVFTITGGTIAANTCGTGGGGAVYNYGEMYMSGGTVTGNTCGRNGGGIVNAGTMRLNGGTVTGNSAMALGGGIYNRGDSVLTIEGGPVITGNSAVGKTNNLYLGDENGEFTPVTLINPAASLQIGISSSRLPTDGNPVVVAAGETAGAAGITSDSEELFIVNTNGTLLLSNENTMPFGIPDFTLPSGILSVEAEAFAGAKMTRAEIPAGCASIGDHAFKDCTNLSQIRIPADCALGADVFSGCGTVYVFSAAGSPAEIYCQSHDNCVFVEE